MSGITRDDWLKAVADIDLRPIPPQDVDALTMLEVQALLGIGRLAAKRRVEALLRDGKAERVKKLIKRTDGAVVTVTAYRLLTESGDS